MQLKCADILYVVGVGEHVDRLNLGKLVSVLNEIFNVACLRVGVAGDVDDALRRRHLQRIRRRRAAAREHRQQRAQKVCLLDAVAVFPR